MAKIDLIDVGALGGLAAPWRDHPGRVGHVLGFEPNRPARRDGERWIWDTAIWNRNGRAPFYVSGGDGSGSSLLEPNLDWVEANFARLAAEGDPWLNRNWKQRSAVVRVIEVEVRTLDHVLGELAARPAGCPRFRFLKSDTQSGEGPVLEGAERFLERDCLGLDLELFRHPLYRGMKLEEEVKAWLAKRGFRVAGWTGYQNSFASQADYLFLREAPRDAEEAELIAAIEAIYRPRGPKRLIKQASAPRRLLRRAKRLVKASLAALDARRV